MLCSPTKKVNYVCLACGDKWSDWLLDIGVPCPSCGNYDDVRYDEPAQQGVQAENMKTFKVTIARILTNYPAKTFTVKANDIVSAQIRVWRKVKTWHHVISAEQCPVTENNSHKAQ